MEVTKSTFDELLPLIKATVNDATFISIDCELTGLSTGNEINGYDTITQYYEKIKRNSKDFLVIQYGVCCFRYDEESDVFKQHAFNFYVFPTPSNKYIPDQRFLCQASSINFLTSQGFDFNKLFKEGITYLNAIQEGKYRDLLTEAQKVRRNNIISPSNKDSNIKIPDNDKAFIDKISKQIHRFIESDDEELVLPKCNSFQRLLVHQTVSKKYEDKVTLNSKTIDKQVFLTVYKYQNIAQRLEEDTIRIEEEMNELENVIGFSKVIRHIATTGKLVIGHNMFLDLLHTIDKFLTPLPEKYGEFKDCAHCLFTNILDTKYMANTEGFKDFVPSSVLGDLFETVKKKPFNIPIIETDVAGQGYALEDNKEHEAGYDAFITGVCFIAMWKYLGNRDNLSSTKIFSNFNLLSSHINRLFLMRLHDSPYIHLGGEDPNPPRNHVFYLTFPKDWKVSDITQLFSPFGNVYISWINDHSAYVGLSKRHEAAVALSTLSQSDTYKIMPYAKRQEQLAGLSGFHFSPLPSRKRSSDGHIVVNKKQRTSKFGETNFSRRSIDPIAECAEADSDKGSKDTERNDETVPVIKSSRKRSVSKTFVEDDSWE